MSHDQLLDTLTAYKDQLKKNVELQARLDLCVEALKKILSMTDQYEDCRDIGKIADNTLFALEESKRNEH